MRRVICLVTLMLLGAGCSSEKPKVVGTSTASPSPTPTDASDLAAFLPDEAPEGYFVVDEQSGPLTLEEASADADDPAAEKKRLMENGFLRGYARAWQSEGGDVIILIADEFITDAGAEREYDASLDEATETGATRFPATGIDDATGLTQEEEGDIFHAVAFVRGRLLFVAAVGGPQGAHEPKEAIELARKIVAKL